MKIIKSREVCGARVVALGTFDGVHLGHRELIRQGKALAEELGAPLRVCTFDRHPLEVLRPEAAPGMLNTAEEQARKMAEYGADEMRVIPFTRETAATEPEVFLRELRAECDVKAVVVGWNYTFGSRGRGNPEMLQADGAEHGYRVIVVPSVKTEEGEIISSTAIRDKLIGGDLAGANEMLGYEYEISGTVVNGKHEGSRIGFPTANVEPEARKQLPAYGVYACRMECEGSVWQGIVNIGVQPTIPSGKVTVEAHALEDVPELYGRFVTIRLLKYIRPERRFDSAAELAEQIKMDIENAKEV